MLGVLKTKFHKQTILSFEIFFIGVKLRFLLVSFFSNCNNNFVKKLSCISFLKDMQTFFLTYKGTVSKISRFQDPMTDSQRYPKSLV